MKMIYEILNPIRVEHVRLELYSRSEPKETLRKQKLIRTTYPTVCCYVAFMYIKTMSLIAYPYVSNCITLPAC